jgi:sporulation-control protein spo0M
LCYTDLTEKLTINNSQSSLLTINIGVVQENLITAIEEEKIRLADLDREIKR